MKRLILTLVIVILASPYVICESDTPPTDVHLNQLQDDLKIDSKDEETYRVSAQAVMNSLPQAEQLNFQNAIQKLYKHRKWLQKFFSKEKKQRYDAEVDGVGSGETGNFKFMILVDGANAKQIFKTEKIVREWLINHYYEGMMVSKLLKDNSGINYLVEFEILGSDLKYSKEDGKDVWFVEMEITNNSGVEISEILYQFHGMIPGKCDFAKTPLKPGETRKAIARTKSDQKGIPFGKTRTVVSYINSPQGTLYFSFMTDADINSDYKKNVALYEENQAEYVTRYGKEHKPVKNRIN